MSTHEQTEDSKGTLRKAAIGLYRFSTSGVYFANVRMRGKLFRQGLEISDRGPAHWRPSARAFQILEAGKPIRSTPSVEDFR